MIHKKFIAHLKIVLVLVLLATLVGPYGSGFLNKDGEPNKAKAMGSITTRTNTVEFLIGRFQGSGTTGKNTNTNNTLPDGASSTIRLRETNVTILHAYIEFNFHLSAYSAQDITSSSFSFDTCVSPCSPNAWASSGNVSSTDQSTIFLTSGESVPGHFLFDVTNEPQLLNYRGEASGTLAVQAGYRFGASSAANSIANATAKLIITYSYDMSSPNFTNTIYYPLEASQLGAQGTRISVGTNGCSAGSCPIYNFEVTSPEATSSNRLSQWFVFGGAARGNAATDQSYSFRIGTQNISTSYIHEQVLNSNGGWYEFLVSTTTVSSSQPIDGFYENFPLTLESLTTGPTADPAIMGGEVADTYAASSSAGTRTKTVRYAIGRINQSSNTSYASTSVNVYFPESGVDIKKAWFRINTSYDSTQGPANLHVTSFVNSSQSASTTYDVGCAAQCVANNFMIYHVIPSSEYTTMEGASATSSVSVGLSTQWAAARGATSAELLITYTYTGDSAGYQVTHSLFAFQASSTPGTFASSSPLSPKTVDVGFGSSPKINSAFLDIRTVYSSSTSNGDPTADPGLGANLSAGASCSVSSYATKTSDTEASEFRLYEKVALSSDSSATSTACAGSSISGMKFGAALVYTYMYVLPTLSQSGYHWRNDDGEDRFSITTPDNDGSVGTFSSLVLDSSSLPVVAYADSTNSRLRVIHCGNADCTSGNVTSSPDSATATDISVEIDSSSLPVVGYITNSALRLLRCGNLNCSSGNTTSAPPFFGAVLGAEMVIDTSSFPVFVQSIFGFPALLSVTHCGNTTCTSGNVTSTVDSAFPIDTPVIGLTSSGSPALAYSVSGLRVARCGNSNCTSGNSTTTADSSATASLSLQLNQNNQTIVVYSSNSGSDLLLLHCGTQNCAAANTTTTIDTEFGTSASLRLSSSTDYPVIAYDTSGDDLKVAYCETTNCQDSKAIMTVDGSSSVGGHVSLRLASSGLPVISYYDSTNTALKVARGHFASSYTSSTQSTSSTLYRNVPKRLRLQVSNTNNVTSTGLNYQLQYGEKSGTCAAISSWAVVGATTSTVLMSDSDNISNGTSSMDVPQLFGGVTNPTSSGAVFSAGALMDTTSTATVAQITAGGFTDIEYSIKVSSSVAFGTNLCFRLVASSTALDSYTYAEATVVNAVPSISSISINNASSMILTPNATTSFSVNFQVTDTDGCSHVFTNGNATTSLYRSGVGQSCISASLSCYITASIANDCSGSNTTANATATFHVYYYADATDASSSYPSENWMAYVQVKDGAASTSAATSTNGVELLTLVAIDVASSTVGYGTISPGSDTGATNTITVVRNTGNSSSGLTLSGTALTLGSNSIPTSSQHYSTTTFTYGGSEVSLSDTTATVSGFTTRVTGWRNTSAMLSFRERTAGIAYRNYLYGMGGVSGFCGGTGVESAAIASDGSLGSWTINTAMPYRWGHSAVVSNDFLYIGGGNKGCVDVPTSTVIYTSSTATGTLNSWIETASFPEGRRHYQFVATGTYLYTLGGIASTTVIANTSSVIYTSSTASGALNPWVYTTALPYTLISGGSVVVRDWIYVIGGTANGVATTTVVRAQIQSNGNLGSWSAVQSLPVTFTNGAAAAVNVGNIIYLIGGTQNGAVTTTVLYAQVNGDGSLDTWNRGTSLPLTSKDHVIAFNTSTRTLYRIGGFGAGEGAATSSVSYIGLDTQSLFWGAAVPSGSRAGSYTGSTIFSALFLP